MATLFFGEDALALKRGDLALRLAKKADVWRSSPSFLSLERRSLPSDTLCPQTHSDGAGHGFR